MHTQKNNAFLDLPCDTVSQIIVVHLRSNGKAKRTTSLMNVSATTMAAMEQMRPSSKGVPTYWSRWPDGKVRVNPVPDDEYELEIMGRAGRPLAGLRTQGVDQQPIESYVSAIKQAERNHQIALDRQMEGLTPRVERFSLGGDE
jgi:hypothetical protein